MQISKTGTIKEIDQKAGWLLYLNQEPSGQEEENYNMDMTTSLPIEEIRKGTHFLINGALRIVPVKNVIYEILSHWHFNEPYPIDYTLFYYRKLALRNQNNAPSAHKHGNLRWSFTRHALACSMNVRPVEDCDFITENPIDVSLLYFPRALNIALKLKNTKRPCFADEIIDFLVFCAKHKDFTPFALEFSGKTQRKPDGLLVNEQDKYILKESLNQN